MGELKRGMLVVVEVIEAVVKKLRTRCEGDKKELE